MRGNQARVVMARGKLTRECLILVVECLVVSEENIMALQKNINRIIIERDFQLVVNSINSKICAHKDIINFVEDIRTLSSIFREIRIMYCNRLINREANRMGKKANC